MSRTQILRNDEDTLFTKPEYWAIETSLFSANNPGQQSHASEKPSFGESIGTVLRLEGSSNTRQLLHDNNVLEVDSGSTDYIFPNQLNQSERGIAKLQLDSIDSTLAQSVLDELSALLNSKQVRDSLLSYLRGLITRAKAGNFLAEAGIKITASREQIKLEKIDKPSKIITFSNPIDIPKRLAAMHQALKQSSSSSAEKE